MSEGQNFEQQNETLPNKDVDLRTLLEKGEIVDQWPFEGIKGFVGVDIKDDGKGIFRSELSQSDRNRPLRVQLELVARLIDNILGFNLVPEIAKRSLDGREGTLQHFIDDAVPLWNFNLSNNNERILNEISDPDLFKAVFFDYLICASDRDECNVLINKDKKIIHLIDHDDYMFFDANKTSVNPSCLLAEFRKRGLSFKIPEALQVVLANLINELDQLFNNPQKIGTGLIDENLKRVLVGIKQRAENLIETGVMLEV